MKRSGLVILAITVLALTAAPARALQLRPSSAPLVDGGGVDSGCDAAIASEPMPSPTEGPYKGSPGWVKLQIDLACTHHWRAWSIRNRWQTVTTDGRRGMNFWGGGGSSWSPDDSVPSPEPFSTYSSTSISPCLLKSDGVEHLPGTSDLKWLLPLGTHDFILGGYAKVNEFKGDLHPYRGDVEKLITVTCTTARARYR